MQQQPLCTQSKFFFASKKESSGENDLFFPLLFSFAAVILERDAHVCFWRGCVCMLFSSFLRGLCLMTCYFLSTLMRTGWECRCTGFCYCPVCAFVCGPFLSATCEKSTWLLHRTIQRGKILQRCYYRVCINSSDKKHCSHKHTLFVIVIFIITSSQYIGKKSKELYDEKSDAGAVLLLVRILVCCYYFVQLTVLLGYSRQRAKQIIIVPLNLFHFPATWPRKNV